MGPEGSAPESFLGRLRRAAQQIGLPAWFVAIDVVWIIKPLLLGVDARHYQAAATMWISGGDPWAVEVGGFPYASGPHTLLFYVPTSLIPPAVSEAVWIGLGVAAAVWLVRRLRVPIWWVAFPPLFHAIWNGNPQTIVVAMLVLGGPLGASLAVAFKLYALLALVTRPRLVAIAIAGLIVSLPFVPWQLYLTDELGVATHLATAWNGSAMRLPLLIPPVIVALWILRHRGAEWLLVPALWPATQFYYLSIALPAVVGRPLVAAALALPAPLMAPVVVIVLAWLHVWQRRRVPEVVREPGPLAG